MAAPEGLNLEISKGRDEGGGGGMNAIGASFLGGSGGMLPQNILKM